MKSFTPPPPRNYFYLLVAALIIFSCKKDAFQEPVAQQKTIVENQPFFIGAVSNDTVTTRAFQAIKTMGENKDFVKEVTEKYGLPRWDHTLSSTTHNIPAGTAAKGGKPTQVVIIPVVDTAKKRTTSYFRVEIGDSTTVSLVSAKKYKNLKFSSKDKKMDQAEVLAIQFMIFDHEIFGYENFKILDNRLFGNGKNQAELENDQRYIKILNTVQKKSTAEFSKYITICVEITEWGADYHCTHTGKCTSGTCDNCPYCITWGWQTNRICDTWWVDDGDGTAYGTNYGSITMTGGGGGGNGSSGGSTTGGTTDTEPCNTTSARVYAAKVPCPGDGGDGWTVSNPTQSQKLINVLTTNNISLGQTETTFLNNNQNIAETLYNQYLANQSTSTLEIINWGIKEMTKGTISFSDYNSLFEETPVLDSSNELYQEAVIVSSTTLTTLSNPTPDFGDLPTQNKPVSQGLVNPILPATPKWITSPISNQLIINMNAYNCHSYAWENSMGDPSSPGNDIRWPKWDNDPTNNMGDYNPLPFKSPNQIGDRIVYYAVVNGNLVLTHSGIVTGVDANGNATEITSKWGQGGVYKHHPRDVPASYGHDFPLLLLNWKLYPSRVYYRHK